MSTTARFTLRGRNPDVLSCIANLSNDEVFTPPELANRMLDTLAEGWAASHNGADIWADPTVTFLDPCTKSGVFLREITRRLIDGLATHIPDLEARVEHILTTQVYGIAITQITSLLARRSLYCSKHAQGVHSIAKTFASDAGNIWFERLQHTWDGDKCRYCGAGKSVFNRSEGLESHAYAFIHADNIKTRLGHMFGGKMQFDVIIGNPPYQLSDGGAGASAAPIYNKFVEQAKKLEPKQLTMVIPSRWMLGGKGLDDFRASMIGDGNIRVLNDFLSSSDAFPGVELQGGVCYFLWSRNQPGDCVVSTIYEGKVVSSTIRPTREPWTDVFIRHNQAIPIVKKILLAEGSEAALQSGLPNFQKFVSLVSASKPFGLRSFFKGKTDYSSGDLILYRNGGKGYVSRNEISAGHDAIDKWKVFIGRANGGQGHGKDVFPTLVLGKPFIGEPGSVSSETYNFVGPFKTKLEAINALSYMTTRFFRFMVLLHKPSQDANRAVYTFVPIQDFSQSWSDAKLKEKYKITDEEWRFVESMVRPMDVNTGGDDE